MGDDDKPSFASFWRKGKQKLRGKASASASPAEQRAAPAQSSAAGVGIETSEKEKDRKEKAQLRRAQVRRAQIQHRQRKANYTKKLELDVSELRDLVSLTEKETAALFKENFLIREALERAGLSLDAIARSTPLTGSQLGESPLPDLGEQQQQQQQQQQVRQEQPELFGDIDIDDLTVTLSMDGVMGVPCFHIRSSSSGASIASSETPTRMVGGVPLTWEQEQRALNFILGLERCCWNHYAMGDFHLHDDEHVSESEHGHTLMASAYCMASAPETIYTARSALGTIDDTGVTTLATGPTPTFTWGASGMSLESLQGLAASLNPGDLEITPVQVWFELASRYPLELLMGGTVMDTLQVEFNGVVRCVMYGAVIERLAFESIIARVLGPSEGSLWT